MVVDSPPGMTSPSTASSSLRRRTGIDSAPASRSAARCSRVSPCSASTPIRGRAHSAGWYPRLIAGQPLLHDRRDHLAGLGEDLALAQRATAAGRRRGLVVEQPLVGAERPHEPHRVVQRRHLQMLAHVEVGDLRRAQQRQVAHVGQRADVQHRVVGQRITVAEPHLLLGGLAGRELQELARHDADVPLLELLESGVVEHLDRVQPGQAVGWRRGRHRRPGGGCLLGRSGRTPPC